MVRVSLQGSFLYFISQKKVSTADKILYKENEGKEYEVIYSIHFHRERKVEHDFLSFSGLIRLDRQNRGKGKSQES
jgi:hypothetical protein